MALKKASVLFLKWLTLVISNCVSVWLCLIVAFLMDAQRGSLPCSLGKTGQRRVKGSSPHKGPVAGDKTLHFLKRSPWERISGGRRIMGSARFPTGQGENRTTSFERLTLSNTVTVQACSHLSASVQLHKHAPNAEGTNGIVAMMMNGGWWGRTDGNVITSVRGSTEKASSRNHGNIIRHMPDNQ